MEKVEGSTICQKWKILEATRAEAGKYSQEAPRKIGKILHIWQHMEHLRSFEPAPPRKNFQVSCFWVLTNQSRYVIIITER